MCDILITIIFIFSSFFLTLIVHIFGLCVCMKLLCYALPSLPPPPQASSGSDSSDIETLDCPDPDDFYEDHTQGYSSLHSSLLSSSLSGFTFLEDAGEIATYAL